MSIPIYRVLPYPVIQELQSKVDLLASKQVLLEQEREKENRRCNILLGNVPEQAVVDYCIVELSQFFEFLCSPYG